MSNLQEFPLDQLKIDLSFVRKMNESTENFEIVRAIVNLAHNLGLNVVAEGVEEIEQQDSLRDLGCEFGQGYLFSKPISRSKVEAFFKNEIKLN